MSVRSKLTLLRDLWHAYARCGASERLRAIVRYVLFYFDGLLPLIPDGGRMLDLGCGNGLLFWLLTRDRGAKQQRLGIDPDAKRIAAARTLELPSADFRVGDVSALPLGAWDVISVVHVLYLVPVARRAELLSRLVAALQPGGVLVLVLNVTQPRWKHWIAYLQERIMVDGLAWTRGATIHFQSLEDYLALVERCGARVESTRRLDRGRPYAHVALVARKPADASSADAPGTAPLL
jgi:SAM-dependent methyltransferase